MKNKFTLLIIILLQCSFTAIQAQISITGDDLPYPGLEVATTTSINPPIGVGKASSQAQIWNYTKLDVAATQMIMFKEITEEDTVASQNFPSATMKSNLLSLFGGGNGGLPIDASGAASYYSQNNAGNVFINGVNINLGLELDSLGLDLSQITMKGDPAVAYYSVGEYGDSFDRSGTYSYTINVPVDSLGVSIPITFELNTDIHTDVDAFGTMQFSNESYEVLRYNEIADVNLFAGVLFFGFPIQTFIDTSFQVLSFRFFTKGEGYPVASVAVEEDSIGTTFIASAEYLAEAGPQPIGFKYDVNCLNVVFENTSDESNGALLDVFWDFGDGNTSILKDVVHNYAELGTYTVSLDVTTPAGVPLSLSKVIEVGCTDIGDIEDLPALSHTVFPNPVNDILHFAFESDALEYIEQIVVFNSVGQQIHEINSLSDVVELNVSTWADGVYFYALNSREQGTIFGDRFVVQH